MSILNKKSGRKIALKIFGRESKKQRAACTAAALALALVFSVLLTAWPVSALNQDESEQAPMSEGFKPSTTMSAVLVKERLHDVELFDRRSDTELEIPGITHLMILYIATQRLPADTMITISKEIALQSREEKNFNNIAFQEGDRLSLRFLLFHMLFNHSDAAALAIVSNMSSSRQAFLVEMQETAQLLGMSETTFYEIEMTGSDSDNDPFDIVDPSNIQSGESNSKQSLGKNLPSKKTENEDQATSEARDKDVKTVLTTLKDTAKLAFAVRNLPRAASIFKETNPLITFKSGDQEHIASFRSPESSLITLSDGKIEAAAFLPSVSAYSLSINYGKTAGGIPILVIAANTTSSKEDRAILNLYEEIDDFYTMTTLARKGDPYAGATEKADNGEYFNLVYLENAAYVHPKSDNYLEPTLDYIGNAPFPLPVTRDETTGQVTFTMLNGVRIQVPVGPDRDILPKESTLNRFISQIQQNPNLASVIFATGVLLSIMLAIYVLRQLAAIFHWSRLNRLEKIAESAHDLISANNEN
ncbi:MAG: hypothetical protein GX939_02955 [Clostridiaceae bacterium]|jgi:D-alanyl-D-alanine carboxypeptidase|nr:hypothetical protein [Clostridiaceae bacterium]